MPIIQQQAQTIGFAYVKTLQGICKIVEILGSFIAVLLVGIGFTGWMISLFESAAAISIIASSLLLIAYVTTLVKRIGVQWNKFQFFFHVGMALYYIIGVSAVLHYGSHYLRIVFGGIIAIVAITAHLVDGMDNYRKM